MPSVRAMCTESYLWFMVWFQSRNRKPVSYEVKMLRTMRLVFYCMIAIFFIDIGHRIVSLTVGQRNKTQRGKNSQCGIAL